MQRLFEVDPDHWKILTMDATLLGPPSQNSSLFLALAPPRRFTTRLSLYRFQTIAHIYIRVTHPFPRKEHQEKEFPLFD
jgi:hypothetical protein